MIPINSSSFGDLAQTGACDGCGEESKLGFRFSYAYQPIVDVNTRQIYAHEALVRRPAGESARSVLDQVNEVNRFRFDQSCRVKAIKTAAQLGMQSLLSINFMPNAIYRPEVCIATTIEAARGHQFPIDRIIFETVEGERVADSKWLSEVLGEYKRIGFLTAIDDFGSGFAGLNLLADFQPDIVKLDMELVRHIDQSFARQAIVKGMTRICEQLGIIVIGEGVETVTECLFLQGAGVHLQQGYLFCKPMFEACCATEKIPWSKALGAVPPM